ncbi:hypothetical protein [Pararhizobium sp.]|uniref:hypothetical protein n=1 Tax=Pararhizobium sp. TaxID=1977563 RepID=UPI003D09B547
MAENGEKLSVREFEARFGTLSKAQDDHHEETMTAIKDLYEKHNKLRERVLIITGVGLTLIFLIEHGSSILGLLK